MAQCSFCGKSIPSGTGEMYVRKDAKVLWFCSNKCEKNMLLLKRKPRNKAWTAEARAVKQAAIAAEQKKEEKTSRVAVSKRVTGGKK